MDEKYKIYCKKISDDLKNASRDNPKHFWKILGGQQIKQTVNENNKQLKATEVKTVVHIK